jgi:hypothetical protein
MNWMGSELVSFDSSPQATPNAFLAPVLDERGDTP